jgi:hypothetical protein
MPLNAWAKYCQKLGFIPKKGLKEHSAYKKQSGKGIMDDPSGIAYRKKHKEMIAIRGKGKMKLQVERPIGIVPDMRRPDKIEKFKGF